MNRGFKKALLVIVALTSVSMADVVFNLGAQQFSNSVAANYVDSTYDLTDSVVSTGLAYGWTI